MLGLVLLDVVLVALLEVLGEDDVPGKRFNGSTIAHRLKIMDKNKVKWPILTKITKRVSPVLPDCLHSGLLADGVDVGAADLVGAGNVVLKVNLEKGFQD